MAIPFLNPAFELFLLLVLFVWMKRILWMAKFQRLSPPLKPVPPPPAAPRVSVIIPARDEEQNIANCLTHILTQSYPNYEVIVVDDRSTDRTPDILKEFETYDAAGPAAGGTLSSSFVTDVRTAGERGLPTGVTRGVVESPLRIVHIEKLPPGWTGKNYAMFAGSRIAEGEWLLFTDADTTHRPESLATALSCALERKLDFLTLAPETESKSFWEKTVQPLASSSLAIWFKPEKINDPANNLVLCNGQFILIRKKCYEKVGGNEAVQSEVVEDVALARLVKKSGFKLVFLNGIHLYSTRMYRSLGEIRKGWKRILVHLFDKSIPALSHKILLFLFFSLSPYFLLAAEIFLYVKGSPAFSPAVFSLSLGLCALISAARFAGNRMVKANPWYGLLHPLGSLVMVWILLCSIGRIAMKRSSEWKGERYA